MMGGGMMGSGFGNFGMFAGLGMLFNLAILIGLVVLVVWAVQKVSHPTGTSTPPVNPQQILSAREILDIRYARGELTREEYQTRLGDIASSH